MGQSTYLVGTRGSALAFAQTNWVIARLTALHPGAHFVPEVIRTTGDAAQELEKPPPGMGMFTKEIDTAVLDGAVPLAVHSMKDVATTLPEGLCIAAVPEREDARDVLVSHGGIRFRQLAPGSSIGTSSPRRKAQLMRSRPDLRFVPMRGNLDTRLFRVREWWCDAAVVASAGLKRLRLARHATETFPLDACVPAVGQGALAVVCREDDSETQAMLKPLDDLPAWCAVEAERAFLRRLGGGCQAPVAAHAWLDGQVLILVGTVLSPDGREEVKGQEEGPPDDPERLGAALADRLLSRGGQAILEQARGLVP